VLGGGISGLIYAFYNQDYRIISPNLGGKLIHEYLSSTILLHDTPETRKLIEDLSIDAEPQAHFIRYFYRGQLLESVPVEIHQMLIAKKLTLWNALPMFNIDIPASNRSLLIANTHIPVFRVSLSRLVKLLSEQVQWIQDRAVRITADEILTEKRKRYTYTDLVSTIPAPEFWTLYQQSKKLQYLPVTFVYSDMNPLPKDVKVVWDLIYFVDTDIKYTRVNRNPDTGDYLYELTGEITRDELSQLYPDLKVKNYHVDPYGVIVTDLNNIPPPNIRFLGRFATWNHTHRIQDTIRESLAYYDFISVWNHQKAFNANFFDFNVKDIELQQRLTKDFVLLLTDEAHELLQQINWKMAHYRETEVNRDRVLEEFIDIFKYWMGIGNVWGFSLEDFFNEFWRKSKVVELRYTPDMIKRIRESLMAERRQE
jgi:hypothetical protein